jgi:hypothetical protein
MTSGGLVNEAAFFVSVATIKRLIAFSSEVAAGSREENASKQKPRAWSVLIQSEPTRL